LSNYFRKFIQNYSILATPLTALSGAKAPWKWGQEQQEAFTKIKEALVRAPILTLPDVRRPFKVVCDACDYGVGAVLFQDGKVCAYFSKKLGASERNYSATERELLAVVYALTEWRCYLLGKPVTVVTDHKCNTFLGQQVGLSPRRARWAERLQEFEIEWVWEPGKTNIADPLSRCFTQHGHPGSGGRDNGVVAGAALRRKRTHPSPDSLTPSSLDAARSRKVRKVTEPAQEVQDPLGTMEQIGLASPSELTPDTDGYETLLGKLGKAYTDDPWLAVRANRRKVSLKGGFWERNGRKYVPALFEERKNGEVVVQNLRRGILEALHDPPHVGHPGVTRMYELLTREWYWPGMYEDVKAYLAHCDSCQRVKGHLGKTGVGSADEFVRKMGLDIRRAQKFLAAAQDRQTAYANRRRSDASFAPGDYVLVDRDFFAVHRKLPQKFAPRRVGPFKVLSSPGPNAYRLEFPDGYDRYHPTVNVNFLTPYRTADGARVRPPPPPPHLVNDHIEYEIGGIVAHKPLMDDRGRTLYDPDGTPHMQYHVRWKGYTPDDDTWEPLTNFTRCRQQVEQYRGSHGLPPLPPRGTIPRIRP
jgi:hypothetical protein